MPALGQHPTNLRAPRTRLIGRDEDLTAVRGLVLHADGLSLRCFDRRLDGETQNLFLRPGSDPPVLLDSATGSEWDFTGLATAGPLCGRRLARVACLKDYWFDWRSYNPGTDVHGVEPQVR